MFYNEAKCVRIASFINGALQLGYSLTNAYKLLIFSKQGKDILSNKFEYDIYHQCIIGAKEANT